nr:FHA domain-containing protein [Desulfobulbaceae bacterium]
MADWTISLHDKTIKTFSITEGQTITIGRGKECDVAIDNTAISRHHLSLVLNGGIFFITDQGSTNGTFVNGTKITTDEPISENDIVEFGKFTMQSNLGDESIDDLKISTSVSAGLMDMDDETIFVTSKQPQPQKKRFKPKAKGGLLTVIQGSAVPTEFELAGATSVKIGKDSSCDIIVSGWFVGKAQCYIIKRDNNFFIVPQKSWAGTFVNNVKISDEQQLRTGDIIKIKDSQIRFE